MSSAHDGSDHLALAEVFAAVTRAIASEPDVESTLARICATAVATIPGCESAGLSLVVGREIIPSVTTSPIPMAVDIIQSETNEGPCLDAIREHEVFRTGHLSKETRWPAFSVRAGAETGIESILSFRLFVDEDTLGSLNLYSTIVDAFDDNDLAVGAVFAAHAAVAFSKARSREQLQRQVQSRDQIGIAKGILMNRFRISDDDAFTMLRVASQRLNLKLRVVADEVAYTGEFPKQQDQRQSTQPGGPAG
jgi:GAF domain-containing protein